MLAKRIVPCLDVDRGRVVKGTNFVNLRDAGDRKLVAQIQAAVAYARFKGVVVVAAAAGGIAFSWKRYYRRVPRTDR